MSTSSGDDGADAPPATPPPAAPTEADLLDLTRAPPLGAAELTVEQAAAVDSLKARWAKKSFLKCSRKSAAFVDYAAAFEPEGEGFPGDAMESVRQNFSSLLPREHPVFGSGHISVFADNLIAYVARCYATSSHVLLLGLDNRSGAGGGDAASAMAQAQRLSVVKGVMAAFGFTPEAAGVRVEDRMHFLWSWVAPPELGRDFAPEHSRDEPYPPVQLRSKTEVRPLQFRVDLRLFYDKGLGEQDELLRMRTMDIYCSVRRSQACTPNLNQIALVHCEPKFFNKFVGMIKDTLDLNCTRCANKGTFRPEPEMTEDRERTPSNQAFCQFFDLSEAMLVDPVVVKIGGS